MSNEQFILELKKRKYWLLLFVIICFFVSFFIQLISIKHYEGSVYFTISAGNITDWSIYEPAKFEKVNVEQNDLSKIFSIIYSNEIIDTIITKFDLYTHYHIDTLQANHYERLIEIIINNIHLKVINESLVALTFKNDDNILAADVGNEIINQVNQYFKKQYKNTLKDKIKLYEIVMTDVAEKDSTLRVDIYKVLNDAKPVVLSLDNGAADAYNLRKKIDYLIDQLYFNKENYLGTYKLYQSALKAIDELDIKILKVLRKALPEEKNTISNNIITSTFISFFGIFVYIFLLYTYLVNKYLIKLFFSKN